MNNIEKYIKDHFTDNVLDITKNAYVIETAEDGKASVQFSSATPCIHLNHPDNWVPNYLKCKKGSDGAIFKVENDTITIHLIECKRTLSIGKLEEATVQLRNSYKIALSVLGILNSQLFLDINYNPCCYICFERMDPIITRKLINGDNLFVSINEQKITINTVPLIDGKGSYKLP